MLTKTKPARQTTLLEYTTESNPRIDKTNCILRNVKILGAESKNGRTYAPSAMRNAIGLYESAPVFLDHPSRDRPGANRSVRDLAGHLRNVRLTGNALFADLHLIKSNPMTPVILDLAENNSRGIGLSHNAEGQSRLSKGRSVVESIERVRSVDLVTNPASTNGLFESLLEMDGMADAKPVPRNRKGERITPDGKVITPNGAIEWGDTQPTEEEGVDDFLKRITPPNERKPAKKPTLQEQRQQQLLQAMQTVRNR